MTSDSVVRARIDGKVKDQAAHVLAGMGLTVSDAIRLMLIRVAAEKAFPFEVRVPNAETAAAIAAARRGEVTRTSTVDELFAELNADD